jgi:hypothetical protein
MMDHTISSERVSTALQVVFFHKPTGSHGVRYWVAAVVGESWQRRSKTFWRAQNFSRRTHFAEEERTTTPGNHHRCTRAYSNM